MAVTVGGVFLSAAVHLKTSFETPGFCLSSAVSFFFLNQRSKIKMTNT